MTRKYIYAQSIIPISPLSLPIAELPSGVFIFFVCLFGFLTSSSTTRLYRGRAPRQERLTILRAATHETELGDHDFCLSRSHYTDTDPTCRERAATVGIEPGTSSPGVARSTAELPRPPLESSFSQISLTTMLLLLTTTLLKISVILNLSNYFLNLLNQRPQYIGVNIRPWLHETPIYRGLGGAKKLLHRTHGFDDVGGCLLE